MLRPGSNAANEPIDERSFKAWPTRPSTRRRKSGPGTRRRRRALRQHQPPDRRPDARKGVAGRQAPASALLAGDAERREGDRDVGGAAGRRPQRRRIRRLAHQDQRRRAVRLGLRRGQSEFERSRRCSTARPRRRRAYSSRARSCCISPRSSARFLPKDRQQARRVPLVAVLADGLRRRSSAAASATSTPTRRSRSNTRSTATRWR